MKTNKQTEDIRAIRDMMEKSSKFLSLNGLSIVFAGLFALLGIGYMYLYKEEYIAGYQLYPQMNTNLLLIALAILFLSAVTVSLFCLRKMKTNHIPLINKTLIRAAYNLLVPMIVGGMFGLIFFMKGDLWVTLSVTLIFYGLGLINTSKYTFREIHYLGIIEVVLGLIAAFDPLHGLVYWTLGFGFGHILWGIYLYMRYDFSKKRIS
ncbi:hypothetical protein LJB98_02325 [Bacteroidales bacterium OttesenSCG-928-M11]|nr:hypothetical protein [Bacteroidales bacterium OttesenSCG-928-M11]